MAASDGLVTQVAPGREDAVGITAVDLRGREHVEGRVRVTFVEPVEEGLEVLVSMLLGREVPGILGFCLGRGEKIFSLGVVVWGTRPCEDLGYADAVVVSRIFRTFFRSCSDSNGLSSSL